MLPDHLQPFAAEHPIPGGGFLQLVSVHGDDSTIASIARTSTGAKPNPKRDEHLIRRLMRDGHTSPFEFASLTIRFRCPIFVARQWVRHRTWSFSEASARYSEVPTGAADFHVPVDFRAQSTSNRQCSVGVIDDAKALSAADVMRLPTEASSYTYRRLIECGVAREQARMVLPLSTMTTIVGKVDAHNLLHFLRLRLAPDAQPEIRVYAERIAEIVSVWLPFTWRAFADYRLDAVTLTRAQIAALADLLASPDAELSGITPDEQAAVRSVAKAIRAVR